MEPALQAILDGEKQALRIVEQITLDVTTPDTARPAGGLNLDEERCEAAKFFAQAQHQMGELAALLRSTEAINLQEHGPRMRRYAAGLVMFLEQNKIPPRRWKS